MTITINRPVLKPRLAVGLGLAAILVVAAFAFFQNTQTDAADVEAFIPSAPAVTSAPAGFWMRLQSLQDNYLPPTVTAAPADHWARLQALQDNYLLPAVSATPAGFWLRLQSLQDNYLPPTMKPAAAEPNPILLSDDRTNRPR